MCELETSRPVLTGERVVPDDENCRETFLEHVARYRFAQSFVRGLRVLDVACGVGYGTAMLAQADASEVIGIDIDKGAIDYAQRRYGAIAGVRFARASALHLTGIVRNPIDLCVSFETIEHLEEPEKFLRDVREILVPSGRLIISTPNRYLYCPGNTDGVHPANPFHRIEWKVDEFISLLSGCFEVKTVLGQVLWPLGRARLYHWMHRTKRKIPEPLLTSPLRVIWRPVTSLVREATVSDLDQRNRVRPYSQSEIPRFVICVCRRRD